MKQHTPGCATNDCCGFCKCDGAPWGKLYVTIHDVTMNSGYYYGSPPECITPRFGQTIDASWFNGVTFMFNYEWDFAQAVAANPNAFDVLDSGIRCSRQGGYWQCVYELAPPGGFNKLHRWQIYAETFLSGGRRIVQVELGNWINETGTPFFVSRNFVQYRYAGECPTGSYAEWFRGAPGNPGYALAGPMDFTDFTADLVWVP